MTFHICLTTREDISQVTELDRASVPTQGPVPNYKHELNNRLAHYIIASDDVGIAGESKNKATPKKGFSTLASRLREVFSRNHGSPSSSNKRYISGFAGFWIMADEAHVTSIAVREKLRRQGIGELLLIVLIELAAELKASIVTLEVRASNYSAQQLYAKYGFAEVGLRRGYYTDNGEDAVLMSLADINSFSVQTNLERLKQAHSQKWRLATVTYQIEKPTPVQPSSR